MPGRRLMLALTGDLRPTTTALTLDEGVSRVRDWDLKWEDQQ